MVEIVTQTRHEERKLLQRREVFGVSGEDVYGLGNAIAVRPVMIRHFAVVLAHSQSEAVDVVGLAFGYTAERLDQTHRTQHFLVVRQLVR